MRLDFFDLWWAMLLIALVSYMIGNVNFAIIISAMKKKDIRKEGSGNPGTMNVSRTLGLKAGLLVLILDISKGAIPVFFAGLIYKGAYFGDSTLLVSDCIQYLAGFFVVLGHICPVVYGFKGGKGIATTIGVFLVAEPIVTLIFAVIAVTYILITEMGSMGSFIATTPSAIAAASRLYYAGFMTEKNMEYGIAFFVITNIFVLGIILMTWIAHRQNIKRLLAGEEHATQWMKLIKDVKIKRRLERENKKKKE